MKITDEIFQVGGGYLSSGEDAAIYLIYSDGHAALVDAGCGNATETVFSNIRSCGIDPKAIEYLLITHCHFDHTGGVKKIKQATNCQIVAHKEDAPFLEKGDQRVTAARWYGATLDPFLVDRKLSLPQEEISLGNLAIEAIHIPGHSPGSVAYLTMSQGLKVLFGQDVHGPLDPALLSNQEDYIHSLNRLLLLGADILCEGHYGIIRGKKDVARYISSFITGP